MIQNRKIKNRIFNERYPDTEMITNVFVQNTNKIAYRTIILGF